MSTSGKILLAGSAAADTEMTYSTMRHARHSGSTLLAIALATSLLSACAHKPAPADADLYQTPTAIQLYQRGEIGAAIAAGELQLQREPDNSVLREQLAHWRDAGAALERDHLQRAEKLWQQNQLSAALGELDAALLVLPENTQLQRRRTWYRELVDRRIAGQRAELRRVRARFLIETLRLNRSIQSIAPADALADTEREALRREGRSLALQLADDGQKLLEKNQLPLARESALLAHQLDGENANALLHAVMQKEKQQANRRLTLSAPPVSDDDSEQAVLAQRRADLQQEFRLAFNDRDLLTASARLTEWRRLFPDDSDANRAALELAPQVREKSREWQREGEQAYRSGQIEIAVQRWQDALLLTPDNTELPGLITRGKKVLSNLNHLTREKSAKQD